MPGSAQATATDFPDVTIEFLNSLASVHSLSEILRDHPGIDRRQKQRFIDIILSETRRMIDIVGELPQLPLSA
jgi:signal transduction histidine kinase